MQNRRHLGAIAGVVAAFAWWFLAHPTAVPTAVEATADGGEAATPVASRATTWLQPPLGAATRVTPAAAEPPAVLAARVVVDVLDSAGVRVANAAVSRGSEPVVLTNEAGKCQLLSAERWRGRVRIVAAGYCAYVSDELSCEVGATVTLEARLRRGVTLTVRVTDPQRAPVPAASVTLSSSTWEQLDREGVSTWDPAVVATTDEDGVARFSTVFPCPVFVGVQHADFVSSRELVILSARPSSHEHNVVLVPGLSTMVTVRDVASKEPVPGLWLAAMNPRNLHALGTHMTDASGTFRLCTLPGESFSLDEAGDKLFRITSDRTFRGAPEAVEVLVRRPKTLAALVHRFDAAPVGAVVLWYAYLTGHTERTSVETAEGRLDIQGQETGAAPWFRVEIPGVGTSAWDRVVTPGSRREPIAVMIQPHTLVTGRVVDARGAPIPCATVRLQCVSDPAANKLSGQDAFDHADAPTDDQGRFTLAVPSDGGKSYAITAKVAGSAAALVFLQSGRRAANRPAFLPTELEGSDVRTLVAGASSVDVGDMVCVAAARVRVKVVAPDNAPPFQVRLTPCGPAALRLLPATAESDDDGVASLVDLAPGEYFADGAQGWRQAPPPIWVGAGRTKLFLYAGDNGVVEIPYSLKR